MASDSDGYELPLDVPNDVAAEAITRAVANGEPERVEAYALDLITIDLQLPDELDENTSLRSHSRAVCD